MNISDPKTVFKIAVLTDEDSDFVLFTNLCQSIDDLNISLQFINADQLVDASEDYKDVPVYISSCEYLSLKNKSRDTDHSIHTTAPLICLFHSYDEVNQVDKKTFESDFWLFRENLNINIFKAILRQAEALYRTRRQANYFRQKYHESEKRFIGVFRSKGEAVLVIDQSGLIRFVNSATEANFGLARNFIGQQFPYDLHSGQVEEIDLAPLTGKRQIVEITVSDLVWENEVCYTVGLRDTSKQRNLEDELVTFRQIIQLSPLPILITDENAKILYVNEQFEKTSGYKRDELIGKRPNILKSDVHDGNYYENLWSTIKSGNSWSGLICNRTKEGELYWEKQLISPVNNLKNETIYYVSIRIDDVQRKKQEEAKQKAETLKSVQELAGGIAHEFSQPLQVLSISMLLMEKEFGESEYFDKSNKMIKRIISLVDSLKSITTLKQQDYLSSKILDIRASSEKALLASQENRILIIDDESELLDSLVELLTISGYNCDGVSDGITALDKISNTPYRLIISDLDMPEMSGIELFKKIKEASFEGYFVFMTGYEVDSEYEDVIKMADAFLTKPFELNSLKNLVDKMIKSQEVKV
ncbi:MAG: PAS domain S-box protein [Calditrichae bacterium]|nr:PAS domain S-box protein [Calditrichia bacterium]